MSQQNIKQPESDKDRENIETRAVLLRLAKERGIKPAETFEDLLGDGGPEDETADDMIRAIYGWRDEESNSETRSYD